MNAAAPQPVRPRQDGPVLICDLDGTLIDSLPMGFEGVERAREAASRLVKIRHVDREAAKAVFEKLAHKMIDLNASDLDLGGPSCNEQVWYRVDGYKRPHEDMGTFTEDETDLLLLSMLLPHQHQRLFSRYAIDFGYSLPDAEGGPDRRFRATIFFDRKRLALSMRMLPWKPRALRSLGFHPVIEHGLMFRYVRDGLTLITGVTGSGKSTTLDAIVDANNQDIAAQVLIVAQPIEVIHESKKCIVRHREVGTDVDSFVDGMVQGLRQDPDIVVVGEMRNPETIEAALEMADTGHKVFSTLHTGSAIETIERIIAEYPSEEQERVRHRLADVLRCIVSQKLLPAIGSGRVLAKEVMWLEPSARAAIKNGNSNEIYQMMWQGADQGMTTLEQDLLRLYEEGSITVETALSYANNKRRLLQIMH